TYVWFDALPNYWTACRFPDSKASWPAQLHVIGKDITRFHCVIWPAMLEAAGEPLPDRVWAHGFIYFGGDRLSKSAGVRLDLREAIERHGPDALRYFLLREVGFANDGNFTWERYDERYLSDLTDGLGNLASRTLAMIEKYRSGTVPAGAPTSLDDAGAEAVARYVEALDAHDLKGGADAAWSIVTAANQFIVQNAPWTLSKNKQDKELDDVLGALARALVRLAVLAHPYMPGKTAELWQYLGQGSDLSTNWSQAVAPTATGAVVRKPDALFPRPLPSTP
ncbi:MAG TPA: class I tRNA ligase family protein, partial [Gemmatimonadales bacterium]|nr:class I tRNA ligase family protein [Gemmatimonadales bacterium]